MSSLAARLNVERQRRHRARARAGAVVLRIAVLEDAILAFLVETGRLTADGALDRRQVEAAVAGVLTDLAGRWIPPPKQP